MNENNIEELAREERNRYMREWREKNKEKLREYNRRYWERRALQQETDIREEGNSIG